ncbi:MAG: hypothetical protein LBO74_04750 [Candidatus Symbiothrix sp.]|jgi:fibronectin type 3 domain-containing protein|nr:hypothetical protein [Candidatus Symbiothrix sp.]
MIKQFKIVLLLLVTFTTGAYAQHDTLKIYLRSNVTKNGIQLRWTVNSPGAWYYTNKNGFIIQRYTLVRDSIVLDTPQVKILTPVPLKPPALDDWQTIATNDNYAAIIAQALYGADFEVSGGTKGVGEMIALSQEQEQRYAMAMYAADLSFPAALFAGWGYEDQTVVKGERYLYRVVPVLDNATKAVEEGAIYAGLDDYRELPRPLELDALFGNSSVLITWNFNLLLNYYNSYFLERSEDGNLFKRLNANPLTNVTESDRIFYTDSIRNNQMYYYRVIGLTPFGLQGPVSDTIQGMGKDQLIYIPNITRILPDAKGGVEVSWEFEEAGNDFLQSFELQRGDTDKGPFATVVSDITPGQRTISYPNPLPENYLRIAAIAKEGEPAYSFTRLLQMPDSIPPAIPRGLEGRVDSLGYVHLKWMANTDADLLGYRVFKGQTEGEELVPVNDIAIRTPEFTDSVSLQNLNAKVYYAVTALDKRYNQSSLSETLALVKPVKIPPASPLLSECKAEDNGIRLDWVTGKDETLVSYIIYRGEKTMDETRYLHTLRNASVTTYLDTTVLEGVDYRYQVTAVNQGNIESQRSPVAYAKAKDKKQNAQIKKFSGKRTDKGIELSWQHTMTEPKSITVYRKESEGAFYLWKELSIWENSVWDDSALRNTLYEYLLVIKDRNGRPVNSQIKVE